MTEDGFYQEEQRLSSDGPKSKQKVLKKIPTEVSLQPCRLWRVLRRLVHCMATQADNLLR
jgi:hypothetical protein